LLIHRTRSNFAESEAKISAAENALVEAHHAQTGLLTQEAQGNNMEISLLAVHSQDHLMTSIAFTDVCEACVEEATSGTPFIRKKEL
jgi:PTS system cellobiose-specific IIA component